MLKRSFLLALIAFVSTFVKAEITIKSVDPIEKNDKTIQINRANQKKENTFVLPEEKRREVERITNEHNQQLNQLRPQIKDKTKALKIELSKDNLDLEALEALNKELFNLKEQQQFIRLKYQVALSKVLTIDERKSLNKMTIKTAKSSSKQKAKK